MPPTVHLTRFVTPIAISAATDPTHEHKKTLPSAPAAAAPTTTTISTTLKTTRISSVAVGIWAPLSNLRSLYWQAYFHREKSQSGSNLYISDRGGLGDCQFACMASAIQLSGLDIYTWTRQHLTTSGTLPTDGIGVMRFWLAYDSLSTATRLNEFMKCYLSDKKDAGGDPFFATYKDTPINQRPTDDMVRIHLMSRRYEGDHIALVYLCQSLFFRMYNIGVCVVEAPRAGNPNPVIIFHPDRSSTTNSIITASTIITATSSTTPLSTTSVRYILLHHDVDGHHYQLLGVVLPTSSVSHGSQVEIETLFRKSELPILVQANIFVEKKCDAPHGWTYLSSSELNSTMEPTSCLKQLIQTLCDDQLLVVPSISSTVSSSSSSSMSASSLQPKWFASVFDALSVCTSETIPSPSELVSGEWIHRPISTIARTGRWNALSSRDMRRWIACTITTATVDNWQYSVELEQPDILHPEYREIIAYKEPFPLLSVHQLQQIFLDASFAGNQSCVSTLVRSSVFQKLRLGIICFGYGMGSSASSSGYCVELPPGGCTHVIILIRRSPTEWIPCGKIGSSGVRTHIVLPNLPDWMCKLLTSSK